MLLLLYRCKVLTTVVDAAAAVAVIAVAIADDDDGFRSSAFV